MKKKHTREEKEFSDAFAEAIEADKQKKPDSYEDNTYTFQKFITDRKKLIKARKQSVADRRELIEAKKQSVSVIGAKGGKRPKINRPILEALEQYLLGKPGETGLANTVILRKFRKELRLRPKKVIVDGESFSISLYIDKTTESDMIIAESEEDYVKSITCSTIVTKYIPLAKTNVRDKKS